MRQDKDAMAMHKNGNNNNRKGSCFCRIIISPGTEQADCIAWTHLETWSNVQGQTQTVYGVRILAGKLGLAASSGRRGIMFYFAWVMQ